MVELILAARKSAARREGRPPEAVLMELAGLPTRCHTELRAQAGRLLTRSLGDEGVLNILLGALAELRDPAAINLISEALRHRETQLKEDYVSFLEYLDCPEAAFIGLNSVLLAGRDDPSRPDLAVTIRAMHALQRADAVPQVAVFVDHPERGVRGVAMSFLFDFDKEGRTAAPLFAEQLQQETEPWLIEMLTDSLVGWHWSPGSEFLRTLTQDPTLP